MRARRAARGPAASHLHADHAQAGQDDHAERHQRAQHVLLVYGDAQPRSGPRAAEAVPAHPLVEETNGERCLRAGTPRPQRRLRAPTHRVEEGERLGQAPVHPGRRPAQAPRPHKHLGGADAMRDRGDTHVAKSFLSYRGVARTLLPRAEV